MEINLISQPLSEDEEALGHQLRSLLSGEEGHFNKFMGAVAFVKFSGVSRIFDALNKFRSDGGTIIFSVGVDHKGTTKEGLELLLGGCDQLFVYHDESYERRTFHPKFYLFEKTGKRAVVIVGSGNLTSGGLFTNYEVHTKIHLNLSDDPQFAEDKAFEFVSKVVEMNFHASRF